MALEDDTAAARNRGLRFSICRKDAPQGRWHHVQNAVSDLGAAVRAARALVAYEAAVFTDTPPPLGGFLYWTSRSPEVLNSTVIFQRLFEGDDDASGSRREFLTEVTDTFFIAGRGLIVVPSPLPGIVPEGQPFRAELRLPDGTRLETVGRLHTEFNVPGPARLACILPSLKKGEVPVGTELWLLEPAHPHQGGAGRQA